MVTILKFRYGLVLMKSTACNEQLINFNKSEFYGTIYYSIYLVIFKEIK